MSNVLMKSCAPTIFYVSLNWYTTAYAHVHLCLEGSTRAEWAIDDVIIAVNDTNIKRFQENFNPMNTNVWYMAMNAIPKITCSSFGNALEFSKNAGTSVLS